MKFSIVIPTYNRERDLDNCLNSILVQTRKPSEVIIVDDGDLSKIFVENWKSKLLDKEINLVYYKKNHEIERRGLSESKNKSLDLVSNEIFYILDDDVVLEKVFCEKIINVWEINHDNHLLGVGGIIKNRRKRLKIEKMFNIIFGLISRYKWDVNKVCFQVWDEEIKEITKGYYAHGGVCSYNLKKAKELKFTTFSGGRTALEDVDFCLRAKNNGYHLLIQPEAQLYHYPSKASREGLVQMGYKEGRNRKVIFKSQYKKPNHYLKVWFCWANIGWVLRQFMVGNFRKGVGMVKGVLNSN